jgi:hypothetical protein
MRIWNRGLIGCPMALALVMAVAACAVSSPQPVSTKSTAAGFDGTYRGEGLPDQIVEECGAMSRPITVEVKGDRVWTHHSHPSLTGVIDSTGQVVMQNGDGSSSLTGLIQGEVLTGTETTSDTPKKLDGFYVTAQSTCTFAIQATRESSGSSDE